MASPVRHASLVSLTGRFSQPMARRGGVGPLRRTKDVAKLRRTSGVTAARRAAATAERCKNMVLVNWHGWEWRGSSVAGDVWAWLCRDMRVKSRWSDEARCSTGQSQVSWHVSPSLTPVSLQDSPNSAARKRKQYIDAYELLEMALAFE